jgi:hypothetical protein
VLGLRKISNACSLLHYLRGRNIGITHPGVYSRRRIQILQRSSDRNLFEVPVGSWEPPLGLDWSREGHTVHNEY